MRALILLLIPLAACSGPGLDPDRDGVYSLPNGAGLTLSTAAAGGGRCDWWSERDHDLSADDAPGFCVTEGSITSGEVFWDPSHEAYSGANIEVSYGGVSGEITRIKLTEVSSGGWLTFDLLVGEDMGTAEIVTLDVKAKRFK